MLCCACRDVIGGGPVWLSDEHALCRDCANEVARKVGPNEFVKVVLR